MAAMSRGSVILCYFLVLTSCFTVIMTASEPEVALEVNKCCELKEIMAETAKEAARCAPDNSTLDWAPKFSSEDGLRNIQIRGGFNIVAPALPNCGPRQQWPIYHYEDSADRLVLMENGWLRHFVHSRHDERHYDYEPRLFCMDRVRLASGDEAQFAVVCNPETVDIDTQARFLVLYILNPVFHALSITFLLATAVVYFIVPQLRDLLGNMVTTLSLCLVVVYAADLVRLFRGFSEHVSFLAAGIN